SNTEQVVGGRRLEADRRILDRVKSNGGAVGVGLTVHQVVQRLDEPAVRLAQRREVLGDAVTGADRPAREQRELVEFFCARLAAFSRRRGETPGEQRDADELLSQLVVNLLAESLLLLAGRLVQRLLEAHSLRDILCNPEHALEP